MNKQILNQKQRILRAANSRLVDRGKVAVGPTPVENEPSTDSREKSGQHSGEKSGSPSLKVNHSDTGAVSSIEVECSCGERHMIRCEYE